MSKNELIHRLINNQLTSDDKLFLIELITSREEKKETSAKERKEENHPNWDDMKFLRYVN